MAKKKMHSGKSGRTTQHGGVVGAAPKAKSVMYPVTAKGPARPEQAVHKDFTGPTRA